jgi:hypothetical protein
MKAARLVYLAPLVALGTAGVATYRDVAKESGIDFVLASGSPKKPYIIESMGGGVALFDYNNDGLLDIYFTNGSTIEGELKGNNLHQDRLYRNNGNGTFTDVTRSAGLGDQRWTMGVAVADVNNDGFDDIYLTNYGPNRLYLNNGDGTFRDASRESGVDISGWSSAAAFADYDGDGDLDLYVSRYLDFDLAKLPKDSLLCRYREIPVQCGPRGLTPVKGRLFENIGGAKFREVTVESGIARAETSFGLGAVWGDYDNDGRPDLYVANDSLPNHLFHNNRDKTFTEVALNAGVALSDDGREQAGMGVDFGDYDNDGNLDLVTTNFSEDYTMLYHNNGDGTFSDASMQAGIVQPTWTLLKWGVAFVDMNNDGYPDIVEANGHVYPEVDEHNFGIAYRESPSLFLNLKNGKFSDAGPDSGPAFRARGSSRGLAVGDINNDGAMDVVISNLDAQPWVIMNPGPAANWIHLKLKGTVSNRDAVGARVTLTAGPLTQIREVKSGGSYQSHSDFRLHFGLGSAQTIDSIRIRWPSGIQQNLSKIKANQILSIDEPKRTG